MKPFAAAAEQNREVILGAIKSWLQDKTRVLEVGSGTGQHAVFFATAMPWLEWQCSDQAHYLPGIQLWLNEAALANTPSADELEVVAGPWQTGSFDAVYSCNTAHIMHWHEVVAMFNGIGRCLQANGVFLLYGPFNYAGAYTSESNRQFDGFLKQQDPNSGIRDKDDLDQLAADAGMEAVDDIEMPANNRILVWQKTG